MSESINKRAIIVGVFIVVGLAFLVGGVLSIGNLHSTFSKKMTISTVFDDVNGLQSGNNIWFSGVKIGTVKRMDFYGKSKVRVIMNINKESRQYIRKDAKVKVSSDGLIGNKILVIYGGSTSVSAVQEGDVLGNEEQLSTEEIMETFQRNNLNVLAITEKIKAGEGTLGRLINSDDIYNSIASAANSIRVASDKAQQLTASLTEFSEKLNKEGNFANDIVTDTVLFRSISASVLELEQTMDSVSLFVSNLKKAGENPRTPVGVLLYDEKAGKELKSTIGNLESGTKKLDENLEALKHSFLLRKYFKKKENDKEKAKPKNP